MMKKYFLYISLLLFFSSPAGAQDMASKANAFIKLLSNAQRNKTLYPFDTSERYRFNYVPLDDRKGISINELNTPQRAALVEFLKTCLSEATVKKVNDIMQLDNILKELEHRGADDHYRDAGRYFVTIFGIPAIRTIWGWRFEGHHVAFHFSANNQKLVAGTPGFLGANPAIVLSGPQKGTEILKEETNNAFALLHTLSAGELKKAIIDKVAPGEIITRADRRAIIDQPAGIPYNELAPAARQLLLQLIKLYINRYTTLFAENMLKEIQTAGLDKLWFAWAGDTAHTMGKAYYYRIQGPTIIIEYDNSQNNANHIHTVIRDLNNDFGGDMLLEHYKKNH